MVGRKAAANASPDSTQMSLRAIARQPGGRSVTRPKRSGGESRMSEALGTQVDVDAGLVEALRRDDPGPADQVVARYGQPVPRLAVPDPRPRRGPQARDP